MASGWKTLPVVVLLGLAGCLGVPRRSTAPLPPTDPFVLELSKQPQVKKLQGSAELRADLVYQVVPLHTTVKEARALMERHGFTCWEAVPDGSRLCLHCTAYHRKRPDYQDRIVVKLFRENNRVVNAEVVIYYDVSRPPWS
jgi:hypothetical protein